MHYLAALEKLKKGSKLYLECQSNPSIFHQDLREELKNKGQKPYVTIITCSDSRVPVQHIFSASMGELFIIRNAGNIIGDFEIGSAEYASNTNSLLLEMKITGIWFSVSRRHSAKLIPLFSPSIISRIRMSQLLGVFCNVFFNS